MIRDGIRALRLFRTESWADTLVAVALIAGIVLTFVEDRQ